MKINPKNVTIVGAGVWGSALANLVTRNHHLVRIWSRHSSENFDSVIADVDLILSAVSIPGVRPTIDKLQALNLPQKTILVTATKGLDSLTRRTPSQLWQEAFPNHAIVVLSGPN
ncbi:MAG: glycerol-3-phosphate dehydrogenase, partial [Hydrococcus sp. RM1_1_31]|nr:glycerol-3-phosphate dehydrogenase [Hydrococcus sp. RM1_1_31]